VGAEARLDDRGIALHADAAADRDGRARAPAPYAGAGGRSPGRVRPAAPAGGAALRQPGEPALGEPAGAGARRGRAVQPSLPRQAPEPPGHQRRRGLRADAEHGLPHDRRVRSQALALPQAQRGSDRGPEPAPVERRRAAQAGHRAQIRHA